MRSIVIGLGETGQPLFNVLKKRFFDFCDGVDIKFGQHLSGTYFSKNEPSIDVMNICIPLSEDFIDTVLRYQENFNPKITIIHSTVPIGTTSKIPNAVHSPILGKHGNMEESIRNFQKWVGGPLAQEAADYLESAGIKCRVVPTSEETEALKLLCLAKYGMSIAFAQYASDIADKYGFNPFDITDWDLNYNDNVAEHLRRPIISAPGKKIGGHCVIQNTKILNEQHPNLILQEILKYA